MIVHCRMMPLTIFGGVFAVSPHLMGLAVYILCPPKQAGTPLVMVLSKHSIYTAGLLLYIFVRLSMNVEVCETLSPQQRSLEFVGGVIKLAKLWFGI